MLLKRINVFLVCNFVLIQVKVRVLEKGLNVAKEDELLRPMYSDDAILVANILGLAASIFVEVC